MRKLPIALVLLALPVFGVPGPAFSESWTFDTAHSAVQFKVRHLMVSSVRGDFEKVAGTIHYDEKDVTKSRADITIDAASINTRVAQRDDHLRSPDFLDAANHRTITFKSKRVEKTGEGRLKVTGDLTIRGVTKPVTVEFDYTGTAVDTYGNTRLGLEGRTTVDRKDWGVNWNAALEAGGVLVSEKVPLEFDVSAIRSADA